MSAIMSAQLFLRRGEKHAFDALPPSLHEGWNVEEETLESEERREEIVMRAKMFRCANHECQKIIAAIVHAKNPKEMEALVEQCDFAAFSPEQIAEIFFTLGTGALDLLVRSALRVADSDRDIEGIAGLTQIRHFLLETNASFPDHS